MVSHRSSFSYMLHFTPVPSSSSSSLFVQMFCTVRLQYHPHVTREIIWDDSRNPTQPQYIQEAPRGTDKPNTPRPPPSYPIVSNPSVNRKQWNDRSWSDQGSASSPNNPPLFQQTSRRGFLSPRSVACSSAQGSPGNYRYLHTIVLLSLYLFLIYSLGLFFI